MKKFKLVSQTKIPEIGSNIKIFIHEPTRAECLVIENKDTNKAFTISFRTLDTNHHGVAHILEHSVLNGSKKFPVKDPFVFLAKNSLSTALNAATWEAMTAYPVGSENYKDFLNLAEVYFDAVFNPLISEDIFMQEGWHYEYDKKKKKLKFGGVVFNEMKGAVGNKERMIEQSLIRQVYRGTFMDYAYGGDPEFIPDLTYEYFLNFHKSFYNPTNAKFVFYGDGNTESNLAFLENLLDGYSKGDRKTIASYHPVKEEFYKGRGFEDYYPISTTEEDLDKKNYFFKVFRLPQKLNPEEIITYKILNYILFESEGALIKKAILDSGLAEDIYESPLAIDYENHIVFGVKNIKEEHKNEILNIFNRELEKLITQGINRKTVLSAINKLKYAYNEGELFWGHRGLHKTITVLDTWNHFFYEGETISEDRGEYASKVTERLRFEKEFSQIKKEIESGKPVLETLIKESILDNSQNFTLLMKPNKDLIPQRDKKEKLRLKQTLEKLTPSQLKEIINKQKKLQKIQDTPDSPEAIATLPKLNLSDINKAPKFNKHQVLYADKIGNEIIHFNVDSNGVIYLNIAIKLDELLQQKNDEDLQYASLLSSLLFRLDLENQNYSDLSTEIDEHSGGVKAELVSINDIKSNEPRLNLIISVKTVEVDYENILLILDKVLNKSQFSEKRLKELLNQDISRLEEGIISKGHRMMIQRSLAKLNDVYRYNEMISGIEYLKFLKKIKKEITKNYKEIEYKLEGILLKINSSKVVYSIGSDLKKDQLKNLQKLSEKWIKGKTYGELNEVSSDQSNLIKTIKISNNEFFPISSQVNYVGNAFKLDLSSTEKYRGLEVLFNNLVNYEYLWQEIRVKGGAYGFGTRLIVDLQVLSLSSYRDPRLFESLKVFEEIPNFLRKFSNEIDEKAFEGFKIGAFGNLDKYLTPEMQAYNGLLDYIEGVDFEYKSIQRLQLFDLKRDELSNFAEMIEDSIIKTSKQNISILGAESLADKMKKNKEYKFKISKY